MKKLLLNFEATSLLSKNEMRLINGGTSGELCSATLGCCYFDDVFYGFMTAATSCDDWSTNDDLCAASYHNDGLYACSCHC